MAKQDDLPEEVLNLIAERIKKSKPHLIKIEEEVEKVQFGQIDLKLHVRAGIIEKMEFYESRTWLKEKELKKDEPKG